MSDKHHNTSSECVVDRDISQQTTKSEDGNAEDITPPRVQKTDDKTDNQAGYPLVDTMVDATPVRRMFAKPKWRGASKSYSPYGRSGTTLVYYRDASSDFVPYNAVDDGNEVEGCYKPYEVLKNGTYVYNPNNGTVVPLHRPTRKELQQTRFQSGSYGNGESADVHHWSYIARNYEYHNAYIQQQQQLAIAGSPSPSSPPVSPKSPSPMNQDVNANAPLFPEYQHGETEGCGNAVFPNAPIMQLTQYSKPLEYPSGSFQQRQYSYINGINRSFNKMSNKNGIIKQIVNTRTPMLSVEELLTEYNYNRGANNIVPYACTYEGRVVLQQLLSLEGENIDVPMPHIDSDEEVSSTSAKGAAEDGESNSPSRIKEGGDCLDKTVEGVEFDGKTIEKTIERNVVTYPFIHAHELLEDIALDMETVALNEHGCHVVRSLVEYLPSTIENVSLLVQTILVSETLLLNMCTISQETRRIPQTLFEVHCRQETVDLLSPLVDIMSQHAAYLAATQQGCIGFMRVFEACSDDHKNLLMTPLVPLFADMACDPFGNYVVQCAVENCEPYVAARYVTLSFTSQCVRLATNKFASNVMEKVIFKLTHLPSVRRMIIDELIMDITNTQSCVEDGYGNFVLQAVIETSINIPEFRKISDRIRMVFSDSPYVPKIEAKLRSKAQSMGLMPSGLQQQHNNNSKPYDSSAPNTHQSLYSGIQFATHNELQNMTPTVSVVVGHPPNSTLLTPAGPLPVKRPSVSPKPETIAVFGPVYTPSSGQSITPKVTVGPISHSQERSMSTSAQTPAAAAAAAMPMSVVVGRPPIVHNNNPHVATVPSLSIIRDATDTENNAHNIAANSATVGVNKKNTAAFLKPGVPAKLPSPEEIPTTFTLYKPSPFMGQDSKKIQQPRAFGNYVDRNI